MSGRCVVDSAILAPRPRTTWSPNLMPGERNWQGKLLALAATLVIAALPAVGWRRVGLTLRQAPGSLGAALPVVALYCAIFVALALVFPNPATASGSTLSSSH